MMELQVIKPYITQIRGVSYKPSDIRKRLSESSVTLLKANNIGKDNSLIFDDLIYVDRAVTKEVQYLKKGDILICASSGSKDLVGKAVYIYEDLDAVFGAFCKVVRPNDNINARYLGYYFDSPKYRRTIAAASNGANINNIRTVDIDSLCLPIAKDKEQKQCVTILDTIYILIDKHRKELNDLDMLVKSRFIEMFGEISVNSKHWKESRLEDLIIGKASNGFFAKPDKYSNDGKIGVICVGDVVNRKYSNINNLRRINMDEVSFKKYKVTYGDMLFCRSSLVKEGIAKASIVPKNSENAVFECHVIRIKLNTSIIVPEYMQAFSTTDYFRNQMIRMSKTATMTTIGQKDIISSSVLVPPIDIQNQFVDFMAQVDKSKLAVQQSLDELETLKKSLMQQYFG